MKLPDPWDGLCHLDWDFVGPFPHLIVDNAISAGQAAAVADEFPAPDDTGWHTFTGPLEEGKQEGSASIAGPAVAAIHDELAGDSFVQWLRDLSGTQDLVADPDRVGGGIHQSGPGARLGVHVDFSVHPRRPELVRAVNVILFLTDASGAIELWGDDPPRLVKAVEPRAGRLIVFEASDVSWHGHPVPLDQFCALRRSIPAYYYRPVRDDEQVVARSTRFLDA